MIAESLAKYLDGVGLVTYDPNGASGDCFLEKVPQDGSCVVVRSTGAFPNDALLGYDSPTIQLYVRGAEDPRPAWERAFGLYDALHGLHGLTLPDDVYLVDCRGMQSGPVSLGRDESGRHEYSINFILEVRSVTAHRE